MIRPIRWLVRAPDQWETSRVFQYEYDYNENGDRVVLGRGTYGVVYAGRDLSNQVRIAIKEIPERDSRWEERLRVVRARTLFCAVSWRVWCAQVLAAAARGDRAAQIPQTQEHCAVPGLRVRGRIHQDLYGTGSRGYVEERAGRWHCYRRIRLLIWAVIRGSVQAVFH